MTIEIADRLVKLRKKYGYSQEELADKLGLSRQAVSKWERAEASPDTDNLICLAKLYGVSLDELLATDEDIDTIVEEQVKADKTEEKKDDRVVINDDGVFLHGKDGASVSITDEGVKCVDKNGKVKDINHDKGIIIINCIEGVLFSLAIIAYILLGTFLGLWTSAWCVIFIPEIICSIARAIRKKNAQNFNMAFLACFAFFFVCMVLPAVISGFPYLWHPMWAVFLLIPAYHTLIGGINKAIGKKDDEECCDNDNDVIDAENVEVKDQD
ncbi:MAG: helix-turn-helix domain-containing protein [Bacilli bacterium]|nr:helix-turn-helix domain-containing protein [Bacilli bacterium]